MRLKLALPMVKESCKASHDSHTVKRALATALLLLAVRSSESQLPFQGPPVTEVAWHASTGNGTQQGDYAAIMMLRESLAIYKAQRARLHWNDSDPCGVPSCNQTCNWKGLVCRCALQQDNEHFLQFPPERREQVKIKNLRYFRGISLPVMVTQGPPESEGHAIYAILSQS